MLFEESVTGTTAPRSSRALTIGFTGEVFVTKPFTIGVFVILSFAEAPESTDSERLVGNGVLLAFK